MRTHLVIPDCQVKPDTPTDHLTWIGKYIVEKKPDVIINIGDFWDMPSLSSYDKGKKLGEGRRVRMDLDAGYRAMERLLKPMNDHNAKRRQFKEKQYKPEMHFTRGNHENRIERHIESNPELDGLVPELQELSIERFGWKDHKFLVPVNVDGVTYSHYFANPKTGRAISGENLKTRLNKIGFTFTQGHEQGYESCIKELNNGQIIRGLRAGSCYLHDEGYMGAQGNGYWRGVLVKREVFDGTYDLMEVSLDYLCRKYEGVHLSEFMEKKYPEIFYPSVWLKRLAQRRSA